MDPLPEDTFEFWLGRAARRAREEAHLIRTQIAGKVPCSESAIRDFEVGESLPQSWEHVIAVYAKESGLDGLWTIMRWAIDAWEAHGAPPPRDRNHKRAKNRSG